VICQSDGVNDFEYELAAMEIIDLFMRNRFGYFSHTNRRF
jgi:hypothetical protein